MYVFAKNNIYIYTYIYTQIYTHVTHMHMLRYYHMRRYTRMPATTGAFFTTSGDVSAFVKPKQAQLVARQ